MTKKAGILATKHMYTNDQVKGIVNTIEQNQYLDVSTSISSYRCAKACLCLWLREQSPSFEQGHQTYCYKPDRSPMHHQPLEQFLLYKNNSNNNNSLSESEESRSKQDMEFIIHVIPDPFCHIQMASASQTQILLQKKEERIRRIRGIF
jgi:hypothetical protein